MSVLRLRADAARIPLAAVDGAVIARCIAERYSRGSGVVCNAPARYLHRGRPFCGRHRPRLSRTDRRVAGVRVGTWTRGEAET